MIKKVKGKGEKYEPTNQISFQLNRSQSIYPYMPMQSPASNEINSLKQELNALRMQMDAQEEENDEEEENILGSIFKSEQFKNTILMGLSSLFMPKQPQMVSGIENKVQEDEKLDVAIETLFQYDENLADDLTLLANMAKENPAQFQMLINLLRK
jgi:hypothetical protein